MIGQLRDASVKLKRIFIEAQLPKALAPLNDLSHNLWWSWNKKAISLIGSIHPEKFEALHYNPVALLKELDGETIQRLQSDKDFIANLAEVNRDFQAYISEKPDTKGPRIAYFSMEYGLHTSLKLYSGGLGVLAGDYLKEASDCNTNLFAVGLLYRYGYFTQSISLNGDQIHNFPPQEFTKLPILPARDQNGDWVRVSIQLHNRTVWVKVWELKVGRIPLYLLDTDFDDNVWEDRQLTHRLYGGDNEHRLKQEILLGIGGIKALRAMNLDADIYHCNEGHAAFLGLERLKNYVTVDGLSFDEAIEVARATALFTTHTPVPAGHDYFAEDLLKSYLYDFAPAMGISWERLSGLGKNHPDNMHEGFSMSNLAIRLSQEVNGVSKLHGAVSQKMFSVLYQGYTPDELHIGYVTNGVHYPTWIANEWDQIYQETFGKKFIKDQSNKEHWRKIHQVPAQTILDVRQSLKKKLLDAIRRKMQVDFTRRGENPRSIFETLNKINDKALVFGFARRFATYKRAHLLFTNRERLKAILNNPDRPVIFLFAGKSHPADGGGIGLIRHIVNLSKEPDFIGKVIFLEDYNMELAKLLVQGVDIWLNFPTRPQEASGTSGMKAALNGVMNFSVLDGWWAEGYRPDAGWALPLEKTYEDQRLQDELDAESIYNILDFDIIPTYYNRDENGIPHEWISFIRNTIAEVAPDFTMKRMLDDYKDRFYGKIYQRGQVLRRDHFKKAATLAGWKAYMKLNWPNISLVDAQVFDSDNHPLPMDRPFEANLKLYLNGIEAEHVGLEAVFFKRLNEDELKLVKTTPLELVKTDGEHAEYRCSINLDFAGVFEYGFRIFPKHELLPHRQELNLVTWL